MGKCRLLGRTEEVIVPTGLPTAMESAIASCPGGDRLRGGGSLRPGRQFTALHAGTCAMFVPCKAGAPCASGACERLNPQAPRRYEIKAGSPHPMT